MGAYVGCSVGSGVVVDGNAVGDGDGINEGLVVGIEIEGNLVGEGVGTTEGIVDGEPVGDVLGKIVGSSVGVVVGARVGLKDGTEVGAQVNKFDTVMLTSLPNTTQCPRQLSNPILCHRTLSGTLWESLSSS